MADEPLHIVGFWMNTKSSHTDTQWTHPRDRSLQYKDLEYWKEIARTAERGKLDAVFFADGFARTSLSYESGLDRATYHGIQWPVNDPLPVIAAMADVTDDIGLAATFPTELFHPFIAARRLGTLDHLTNGRFAWNIVTSANPTMVETIGKEPTAHDERYDRAEEYMDLCYKYWEHAWEDGAIVAGQPDVSPHQYADPEKVHKVIHHGEYFDSEAYPQVEPLPQGTPVLYQAGQSDRGVAFAAKHAEVAFTRQFSPDGMESYVDRITTEAKKNGRSRDDIKLLLGIVPFVAPTEREAQAKYETVYDLIDPEASLAKMSEHMNYDFLQHDLDEPIDNIREGISNSADGTVGLFDAFAQLGADEDWTLREAGKRYGIGNGSPTPVGTPQQVVDELLPWRDAGADGFMITQADSPGTIQDVVDFLIPELQRRGLFREEYDGGTHREIVGRGGPELPENHRAKSDELREIVRDN
ncbi:NtaA/DmoA family FMN-dependent monooxygenase [Natrinema halophilum]|uniref:NtaA/DmoA family FMN-dependent monooxygenase n=1 Tax=Natrinema halophilum TaxID=1699371 RepID=UPI001EEB8853|nr:NtaA/DmoA family FMN-dependent monooxygenase [Natrinema halophilum]UHQ96326.1 NtaA/DmoA family FMN-dependent monooxygenase [Natrinema halophilum]